MKIRRWFEGFMLIVFLGASAAALQAQGYKVFVMGGGSSLFDRQHYTVYGASFESHYQIGFNSAAGAEIPLTRMFSAEGSYGFARNNLLVTNFANSTSPNQRTGYEIQNQRVSGDIVAHAAKPFSRVRPYLVAGVEYDRFSPTSRAAALAKSEGFNGVPNAVLPGDNKFGVNFGGGVDIGLTHMLAFRLDARDHITLSPSLGLSPSTSSAYTTYYPVTGRAHNVEYSAGIVFQFGK